MSDIVERLRNAGESGVSSTLIFANDGKLELEAAAEIDRLRERIAELKPYEVVSGDTWKARVAHEKIEEQAADIKLLEKERDTLNARIKGLQAKIKAYETPAPSADISTETKSSPELEGVSG